MREIFVTNHNDFHHTDSYDGVEYDFPPKERVSVSIEAAIHMFGFNQPDKSDTLTRLGWSWRYSPTEKKIVDNPDGVKWLSKFVFTKAMMVEAPADVPDPDAVADESGKRKTKVVPFLENSAPLV